MNFLKKLIHASLITLSLALVGSALLLFQKGYRPFFVSTPSMGMTAPVGTLIITQPQTDYKSGDIIAFNYQGRVYTHRITQVEPNGFRTKGDLNHDQDAWVVAQSDVIGKQVFVGRHVGWIWRALPWFVIGMIIVWLISLLPKLNSLWRWPIRLIGLSIVITLITIWLRPWISFGVLGVTSRSDQAVDIRIVNTGVFALRAQDVRLVSGQDGVIKVTKIDSKGRFVLVPRPSLDFWEKVFAIVFCLSPLIISLLIKNPYANRAEKRQSRRANVRRVAGIVIVVVVTTLLIVMQFSSLAAILATIRNQYNGARTANYFTCRDAMSSGVARPIAAYAMNTQPSFWSPKTEPDISGNNNAGWYRNNMNVAVNYSDSNSCHRDRPAASAAMRSQCLNVRAQYSNPTKFSLEVRFRTNRRGASNGKLVGFGTDRYENDGHNDRHIYLDKAGRIVFGTYNGRVLKLASPAGRSYSDNQWHHVVVTFSENSGTSMYIDGQLVADDKNLDRAQNYTGYWKFGCGRMAGWQNADGTPLDGQNYFSGNMQFGAIYNIELSADQVKDKYLAGKI